jgi:hypothetical protein
MQVQYVAPVPFQQENSDAQMAQSHHAVLPPVFFNKPGWAYNPLEHLEEIKRHSNDARCRDHKSQSLPV